MPWNGSGVFTRIYSWVTDAANSIPITASRVDGDSNDFVTGLNNCLTRDGQGVPTANLPMANFRHTGVANGQARNDYATVAQLQDGGPVWLSSVAGTDTITATLSPAITSYTAGQSFRFIAVGDNTGSSVTLNVNGVGAAPVTKNGSNALNASDIKNGSIVIVTYDGARFQLISGAGGAASVASQIANGGTNNYTLTGSPGTVYNLEMYIHGVRQTPTVDYNLSGVTVTTTVNTPSGTGNILFIWRSTIPVNVPSAGSVVTASFDPGAVCPNATNSAQLGGQLASAYALLSGFGASLSANGYQKLPSGFIIQWGISPGANPNSLVSITYPISFTSATYAVFLQYVDGSANTGAGRGNPTQVGVMSATGFNFYHSGTANNCQFLWVAIGR